MAYTGNRGPSLGKERRQSATSLLKRDARANEDFEHEDGAFAIPDVLVFWQDG